MTANKQKRHQPASKADQGGVFAAAFDFKHSRPHSQLPTNNNYDGRRMNLENSMPHITLQGVILYRIHDRKAMIKDEL
jgi:hypothetical protein